MSCTIGETKIEGGQIFQCVPATEWTLSTVQPSNLNLDQIALTTLTISLIVLALVTVTMLLVLRGNRP